MRFKVAKRWHWWQLTQQYLTIKPVRSCCITHYIQPQLIHVLEISHPRILPLQLLLVQNGATPWMRSFPGRVVAPRGELSLIRECVGPNQRFKDLGGLCDQLSS